MTYIFSVVFNESRFLLNQYNSFRKHVKNEFLFTVIDNSFDPAARGEIRRICDEHKIRYINLGNTDTGMGSLSHAKALNYILKNLIDYNHKTMLLDHDVYAIADIDIENIYYGHHFAGVYQVKGNGRYEYLHPGFMFIDSQRVSNLHVLDMMPCELHGIGLDTGGRLAIFAKDLNYSIKFLDYGVGEHDIEYIDGKLVHFRGGSNWNNDPNYPVRLAYFNSLIKE